MTQRPPAFAQVQNCIFPVFFLKHVFFKIGPPSWCKALIDFERCRTQIIASRTMVPNLDEITMGRIQNDLVGYCRQRRANMLRTRLSTDTPELDNLREVVFSIPLVSAFVKSLFSKMDYNQSKHRSQLADDTLFCIVMIPLSQTPSCRCQVTCSWKP